MFDENLKRVELHQAVHWYCDECGTSNFEVLTISELTEEERADAYRHFHDLEDWQDLPDDWMDFELVSTPLYVTCSKCQTKFRSDVDGEIEE